LISIYTYTEREGASGPDRPPSHEDYVENIQQQLQQHNNNNNNNNKSMNRSVLESKYHVHDAAFQSYLRAKAARKPMTMKKETLAIL
jgi:hypothetical protein